MKTFKDLTFEFHHSGEGIQALLNFDNGRGISVLMGSQYFYTSDAAPYEVAFIREDGELGNVYLSPHDMSIILIEDEEYSDVVGYCTKEDVIRIMEAIQKL